MTRKRIIAIIVLFMLIFQISSPVIYAVEDEIQELNTDPEVVFANEGLKNYLLANNDYNNDGIITASDMAQITEFSVAHSIETTEERINLKGFEYATSLEDMRIWVGCENYSVLSNLQNLKKLSVVATSLDSTDDYEAITKIPNLKYLDLSYVDFTINNLYDLPIGLEGLNLMDCNLENIENIEQFSNLTDLSIRFNRTSTIQGLENINKLSNLKNLTINRSDIEDIGFLENNETIELLDLSYNKIKNIDVIPTMKKLTSLYINDNQIADITPLEEMEQVDISSFYEPIQQLSIDKGNIEKGKALEIELPKTIQCCYNQNSRFFVNNAKIESTTGESVEHIVLSEDKTKITIDTTNLKLGEQNEELQITGDGILSGTTLDIKYCVIVEADSQNEVIFSNESLKQYFLDNHDYDSDGKITEFDMAQITELDLTLGLFDGVDKADWEVLEYCENIEELCIGSSSTNYEVMKKLPKLTKITCYQSYFENEEYEVLTQLSNLKELYFRFADFTRQNLYDLPENLEKLSLSDCEITDLKNIDRFANLTDLYIFNVQESIDGLENITKLTKLQNLSLTSLKLADISFLENNETITKLDVSNNQIKDISIIPTIKKLNYINISGNQIFDMSSIANMEELLTNCWELRQNYSYSLTIKQGEKIEIDLPQTIIDMYNPDSVFYLENNTITPGNSGNSVTISEDKTKLIIDATNLDVGPGEQYFQFYGNGLLAYTTMNIDYHVVNEEQNEIEFASETIKKYILENHDINCDGKITAYDMQQITELSLPGISYNATEDLKGLEHAINLKSLYLPDGYTNIETITNLSQLEELRIEGAIITTDDYKAVGKFTGLKSLRLFYFNLNELSILDLPKNIETLIISNCDINDISNIKEFTDLTTLEMCYNNYTGEKIQGIENINQLANLKILELRGMGLQDINFLENNTTIENLDIAENRIKDISVISTLTTLKDLWIEYNRVEDLSVIETLPDTVNIQDWAPQNIYRTLQVNKGKNLEIELPPIITNSFNPNYKIYMENARLENDSDYQNMEFLVNEDKTKLILYTENLEIGNYYQEIRLVGSGMLGGTSLIIDYTVIQDADNQNEIVFDNEQLKQFFLENYDIDNDDKITAYDMAQISNLDLPYIDEDTSLEFLKYCISLKQLSIDNHYTGFDVLLGLTKLKDLYFYWDSEKMDEFDIVTQLENLTSIRIYSYSDNTIPIHELPKNITSLSLYECTINDISCISEFANLTTLTITYNKMDGTIPGIENINKLSNLTELEIWNSGLIDLTFLTDNETIENLYLSQNKIKDISPIMTMKKLKYVDLSGNQIEDLSILENTELLNEISSIGQDFRINDLLVFEGEKLEIDTPKLIKDCFDNESTFYIEAKEISVHKYEENQNEAQISEDGSKVILDTSGMALGEYTQEIKISGYGRTSGTTITLNYKVAAKADNTKEVQFGSEKIKQYILEYYDYDKDGKITEFDMAQITYLYLSSYNIENAENENLQGLEYCTSLKELEVSISACNYSVIEKLQNIEKIGLYSPNAECYQSVVNLQNLKTLYIGNLNLTNLNLADLPKTLENIHFSECTINDIQNISEFSNLKSLDISYINGDTQLQGLDVIGTLENLTNLRLDGDNLEDLSFLNNNNTIESLSLSDNNIKDITPITTMTNLKSIYIADNQIENISVLNDKPGLIENSSEFRQQIWRDFNIFKGEKLEIELPDTIRQCFNQESKFFVKDANVNIYNRYGESNVDNVTISEDKTKLIIDATNDTIGQKGIGISIVGDGKLSYTSMMINYTVTEKADNITPIEFDNKELEQYILNHHDIDKDGKITAYDMVQIKELYAYSIYLESLKGIEYAKNLELLSMCVKYENYNEQINYDFSQLSQLTKLKILTIGGDATRIDTLSSLSNLTYLSIGLSYEEEKAENQLKQISALTNLNTLSIMSGKIKNLDLIKNLTKLQDLTLSLSPQDIENFDAIANFTNLRYLYIELYQSSSENVEIDYSFLKKLTKMENLYIKDYATTSIDLQNIANMNKLNHITFSGIEVKNVNILGNLTSLYEIRLDACKITNIDFIKDLPILQFIYMQNNFITDISPLEDLVNLYYADFTNNPIGEIDEKYEKILQYIQSGRIILTEYSLTENLIFENQEFKNQLLNYSYDINRDGEISKYEMSKINYLYTSYCIENAQYLTNLQTLSFGYINLTKEEQTKFIEQINMVRDEAEISISGCQIDLGNITEEQYMEVLVIKEMQNPDSRIYMENLICEEQYDENNVAEIVDGKVYFNENAGDIYYTIRVYNETKSFNLNLRWKKIVEGDATKVIHIEDPILRQEILNNHDIDNDKKITEYDMINISILDISQKGVRTLKGLEYAKNLMDLYAYGNKIKNISPLISMGKSFWGDLSNNEITDITCIANSKSDETLNLCLVDNYIDFLGNTKNIEVLKNDYKKSNSENRAIAAVTSAISSQKYGKPNDADQEVILDSKIKQKLLKYEDYEIDTNNDSKFTRRELYDAHIYELDLSGLGLTNVNGLEYLKVYNLNLSNNNLTDISPLGNNRTINLIDLSNNNIKDISCFANYNNFYWGKMDFSNNQIEDISSIKTWPVMAQDIYNDWYESWPISRDIEIDLSNNKIEDISAVKDFVHISKLDLSGNEITNIEPLADFDFVCYKDEEITEEALEMFEGIILDDNYINKQSAGNKKAIEVFKNKNVTLKLDNQKIDVAKIFTDIKRTDWYYTAVQYSYKNNMIKGLNETTFAPTKTLTRGMLVTILHRMEGSPTVSGTSKFSDVQNTKYYYYNSVIWATQNRIVSGYNNGKFGPDDSITREQLAVILNNYCKYKGKYKETNADLSKYKDASKISGYARNAMNWAVSSGVITGTKEGYLKPQGTATRAEAASMLYKYCKNVGR